MKNQTADESVTERDFTRRLLDDLERLERLLDTGAIESDIRRIGAEQELFLVDGLFRPKPSASKLLKRLRDPRFTSELALFNLEINLDPQPVEAGCLKRMEFELEDLLAQLQESAAKLDTGLLLTGILPTLDPSHLTKVHRTPKERYKALADAVRDLRGDEYELRIQGADELWLRQSSVMPEACNASFQVHLQVSAEEFARFYNAAQVAAAPVIACAAASPLLFGRRLWRETRIPLFQQSIDERRTPVDLRRRRPRVDFGREWVRESVLEIFREDVARYRVLLAEPPAEPSGDGPPRLDALCLFNSTVYRWNRPCYGVFEGRPHLRIENRFLPSGPSVIDQMANAAFWIGLVYGLVEEFGDVGRRMPFDKARGSFLAAARHGLATRLHWPEGGDMTARDLVLKRALPLAREGLVELGIPPAEIDRYLGPVKERAVSRQTPARWMLDSFEVSRSKTKPEQRLAGICAAVAERQLGQKPVARWPLAPPLAGPGSAAWRVRQVMAKDFITVHPEQSLRFAVSLMDWHRLACLPVEDDRHHLEGLLTKDSLTCLFGEADIQFDPASTQVRDVMKTDVPTVAPGSGTRTAAQRMLDGNCNALPVTEEGRLVGLLRAHDLLPLLAGTEVTS